MQVLLNTLDVEILLALLWSGPYLTPQLQQMFTSTWSFRQLQRRMQHLEHAGLIEAGFFYRKPRKKLAVEQWPQRVGRVWSITERGQEIIAYHDRAPYRPTNAVRFALLDHDTTVSAVIAHIIARTRPLLSGLAVFREMRVDDQRTAPIADTILVLRTRGVINSNPLLPWTRLGAQPDEGMRVIAIESDRSSESLGVIAEKARVYQLLTKDEDYLARYAGVMPMPVWIAPTRRRAQSIHTTWQRVWTNGTWLQTTDAGLKDDIFIEYHEGKERSRTWLDDWEKLITQPKTQ